MELSVGFACKVIAALARPRLLVFKVFHFLSLGFIFLFFLCVCVCADLHFCFLFLAKFVYRGWEEGGGGGGGGGELNCIVRFKCENNIG